MSKALGTDDSITTCDCCGKSNLKHTVVIELDDGEIVHYGSVCATRNTGKASKVINSEIRAELARKVNAARAEYRAHPAYIAERARFAERDLLPFNDPRRLGMQAAHFVREACAAADLASAAIASRFNLNAYEVRA